MLIAVLKLALLDPVVATVLGAWLAGEPELSRELLQICRRESHCRFIGEHPRDRDAGPAMRRGALRVGWLDAECPFVEGDGRRFSTRGIHGLSAAYSLRFLGHCLPPELLDVPLFSAIAAARRSRNLCRRQRACTTEERRRHWIGALKYDRLRRHQAAMTAVVL
jgi:hypothetical protein